MNMNRNISESKRVPKAVRAKRKQCYINAMRVVWYVPEYEQADYVEGYAVIDGNFCIEHGWVEREGLVIDPTLLDDTMAYFPGLRFTGGLGIAEARQMPKKNGVQDLPILNRFGWGGINSFEFRSAIVAAYRYAGMEDLARLYEEYRGASAAESLAV